MEQRERENKVKLNEKFRKFANNIGVIAKRNKFNIDFDTPFTELAFTGAPGKSVVKMLPTVNCLVNLTEQPFFILSLEDIALIHFERINFQLKNFDMAIIYKDFTTVERINFIPSENLDLIKKWADNMDLVFTESQMVMNWQNILQEIRANFEDFLQDGGWSFLRQDQSEENDESGSEGTSEVNFSKAEEESSESSFSADEEDSSSYESEESADEGMDWDELDKKALEQDRKIVLSKQKKQKK